MHTYLVIADNMTTAELENQFQDQHVYELRNLSAWMIGTHLLTCADVSAAVGLSENRGGFVVKVGEYYGFYDTALWQKIDAWRQM